MNKSALGKKQKDLDDDARFLPLCFCESTTESHFLATAISQKKGFKEAAENLSPRFRATFWDEFKQTAMTAPYS